MQYTHRLIFSVVALAAIQPAAAQFEVSPDHFDQSPIVRTPQSARAEQKLKESMAEEQALLESYAAQLTLKEQQVEERRQEAISAGISGDGAGMSIALFRNEQRELQTLHAVLTPLMIFSREVLAGLHNDLDMLEAGNVSFSAQSRRSSKTLQASARTGR